MKATLLLNEIKSGALDATLTHLYGDARLSAQKDDAFFRENADILIENNGGRDELLLSFSRALETLRAQQ